jgi:hypothetical protein
MIFDIHNLEIHLIQSVEMHSNDIMVECVRMWMWLRHKLVVISHIAWFHIVFEIMPKYVLRVVASRGHCQLEFMTACFYEIVFCIQRVAFMSSTC